MEVGRPLLEIIEMGTLLCSSPSKFSKPTQLIGACSCRPLMFQASSVPAAHEVNSKGVIMERV